MTTIAGSVTIDGTTGVASGTGTAKALYDLMSALPAFAGITVGGRYPGLTLAGVISARKALADQCNTFASLSDGPQWIPTGVKTSAYASAPWEYVKYNPTGGSFTITLPNPATVLPGVAIRLKNVSSSTNAVTVSTVGGSLIDGFATITQAKAIQCVEYASDGANWAISAAYNE